MKGFYKTGCSYSTVGANEMFAAFPKTAYGGNSFIKGIPATGLTAWFSAGNNVTLNSSGNVSTWNDLSGIYTINGNNAAYVTNSSAFNYNSYINTAGVYLTGGNTLNIGTSRYFAVLVVVKINATINLGTTNIIFMDSANGLSPSTIQGSYRPVWIGTGVWDASYSDENGQHLLSSTPGNADNNLHIHCLEIDRQNGRIYYSLDSQYRVSTTTGVINQTYNNYSNNNLFIGGEQQNFGLCPGYLFDILYYNTPLSQSDYSSIRSYFGSKYVF